MNREELSNFLFSNIVSIEPYPDFVAPVTTMIDITAFFPGGKGLWKEEQSDIFPSVLVLGQDFSTEQQYNKMLNYGATEIDGPTWRNLRKLFHEANINLLDCFFSNVFMGLRKTKSMIGKFPGIKDKAYVSRNIDFLMFQIETIKPKIIISLGKYPSEFLSQTSSDLICWQNYMALKQPDNGIVKNVHIGDHVCTCVALEHPSMRNSNIQRRKYQDSTGNEAEIRMLKEAFK